MAQAARLSLRMQKELKLLLSDPPPGASFPLLMGTDNGGSVASSSSDASLSAIDAEIEGPEGTVYAGGIFTIKIQISERYPFQPPIVTFATPIYHPNIDNGGRICLDILNLPPKGAWQPSLNISTVITSIGLLLSEPNPDDGLMCEASKEYKYNRQAFNLKARTMTERHAKPGCCAMSWSNQSISSTVNMDYEEAVGKSNRIGAKGIEGQRKPLTSKLSLNSSLITSAAKGDYSGGEVKYEPANPSSVVLETEKDNPPSNSRKRTNQEPCWVEGKSGLSRRRLSLNCSSLPKIEHHSSSTVVNPEVPSSSLSGSKEILATDDSQFDDPSPQVSSVSKPNAKKSATGRKLSLGFSARALHKNYAVDEKENLKPVSVDKSGLEAPQSSEKTSCSIKGEILDREMGSEKCKADQLLATETVDELQDQGRNASKHRNASSSGRPVLSSSVSAQKNNYSDNRASAKFHGAQKESNPEAAPPPVSVIVLDSDDSDEERNVCKRPRLSISRKRHSSKATNNVKHC